MAWLMVPQGPAPPDTLHALCFLGASLIRQKVLGAHLPGASLCPHCPSPAFGLSVPPPQSFSLCGVLGLSAPIVGRGAYTRGRWERGPRLRFTLNPRKSPKLEKCSIRHRSLSADRRRCSELGGRAGGCPGPAPHGTVAAHCPTHPRLQPWGPGERPHYAQADLGSRCAEERQHPHPHRCPQSRWDLPRDQPRVRWPGPQTLLQGFWVTWN